jgi:hypothetical protein
MRKARGALLASVLVVTALMAGVPRVTAAGNYVVSIDDVSATEGAPLAFRISVSPTPAAGDTVQVQAATSDGTAQGGDACPTDDYFDQTATVVLDSTTPSRPFNVQTCDDAVGELAETVFVQLSQPTVECVTVTTPCTVTFGDATGRGTINDNDSEGVPRPPTPMPAPLPPGPTTLTAVDVNGRAGPEQNCIFSVNRDGDASKVTTVGYVSAARSKRVANVSGTLMFGVGETVKTVEVDVLRRPRRQKFVTLTLSGASNATIIDGEALCELKTKRRRR